MSNEKSVKPENHIQLTVVTVDGNYTDDYNKHNPLQKVVDKTIDKLDLLYDLSQYELLKAGSTVELDLSISIEQAELKDGDELQLRRRNGGGGERL